MDVRGRNVQVTYDSQKTTSEAIAEAIKQRGDRVVRQGSGL